MVIKKQEILNNGFVQFGQSIVQKCIAGNIGDGAKVLAYYFLLSLFPLTIALGNILPYLNFDVTTILDYIQTALPSVIYTRIEDILRSLLQQSSHGLLSFGLLATLWALSRGINALKNTINRATGIKPLHNFIISRILSLFTTIVMLLMLIMVILGFTFGQFIIEQTTPIFHWSNQWLDLFMALKWPVTALVLLIALIFLYYFLPSVKLNFLSVLPGAILATVGWLLMSQLFTLYLTYFGKSFNSYGAIGAMIVMLLWLNFNAMILIFGAIFNTVIQETYYGPLQANQGVILKIWQKRKNDLNKSAK